VTQAEPLSFEAFQAILADLLKVDVDQVRPEAYFVSDLGADSLRLLQMLLYLEEQGVELSLSSAWQIQTVSDAYRVYQENAGSQGR
jgi:acyl carrier protein